MAWIEKRRSVQKNGRNTTYLVRWREPGTHKMVSGSAPTFELARSRKADIEKSLFAGDYVSSDLRQTPFGDYLRAYLASKMGLAPSTRYAYEGMIDKHILSTLGNRRMGGITAVDMRRFFGELQAAGAQPPTLERVRKILVTVFRAAQSEGLISRNPMAGIAAPRSERRQPVILDPETVEALADTVPERYRVVVLLAAYGGLRIGEIAALRTEDIDLLHRRVTVRGTVRFTPGQRVIGAPKSAAGRRSVAVPGFLADAIAWHATAFPGASDGRVFCTAGGRMFNGTSIHRIWKAACTKLGLDPMPHFHDLRHTAAALAIREGAHPKEIQQRMGHANISITMDTYGHLFPGMDEELAGKLGAVRAAALEGAEVVSIR